MIVKTKNFYFFPYCSYWFFREQFGNPDILVFISSYKSENYSLMLTAAI